MNTYNNNLHTSVMDSLRREINSRKGYFAEVKKKTVKPKISIIKHDVDSFSPQLCSLCDKPMHNEFGKATRLYPYVICLHCACEIQSHRNYSSFKERYGELVDCRICI